MLDLRDASVKRPDLSHGLVHLTRDRPVHVVSDDPFEAAAIDHVVPAFDVLKEMLQSGTIRGSGNQGYIKGRQRAVCFSEIPISAVHHFAKAPEETAGRYRFYGLSLSKSEVFQFGGRPVIYLPDSEGSWIPENQRWRHVRFEYGSVDFTHEREWRAPGDLNLCALNGFYVLVWSASEAEDVLNLKCPVRKLIRGVLPMQDLIMVL